jgi:hypothetical protein
MIQKSWHPNLTDGQGQGKANNPFFSWGWRPWRCSPRSFPQPYGVIPKLRAKRVALEFRWLDRRFWSIFKQSDLRRRQCSKQECACSQQFRLQYRPCLLRTLEFIN